MTPFTPLRRVALTAPLALALVFAIRACSDDDDPGVPATGETTATGDTPGTTPTGDTPGTTPTDGTPGTTPTGGTPGTTPTDGTPGTTPTGGTVICGTDETLCTASDDTQFCANLDTDPEHCGECGNLCNLVNADAACVDGECEIASCTEDFFASCDDDDATGCETDTNTSRTHCGDCDSPCDLPGAESACNAGSCELLGCIEDADENPLFGNCDDDESTGCETDLMTSRAHCGACNIDVNALDNVADARCEDGVPDIRACDAGFANCDGDWSTGCEADISDDATCGPTCLDCGTIGDGTVAFTCQAIGNTFTCQDSGCAAGFGTCGSDGECETNLLTSNEHCGACDEPCEAVDNSSATCVDGSCEITCDTGLELCTGTGGTDVCADLETDDNHCGACGESCPSGEECVNGQCRCAQGFTACGESCVNLQTSTQHCGSCDNECPAVGRGTLGVPNPCDGGSCYCDEGTTYCRASRGFAQPDCCDSETEVCSGTLAVRTCECASGLTDCGEGGNRDCVSLQNDFNNCGSCGRTCAPNQTCFRGNCIGVIIPF